MDKNHVFFITGLIKKRKKKREGRTVIVLVYSFGKKGGRWMSRE